MKVDDDGGGRRVQLDRPPPRHRASHHRPQPSWLAQQGHGGRDAGEDAQQGSHPQVQVRSGAAAILPTLVHMLQECSQEGQPQCWWDQA